MDIHENLVNCVQAFTIVGSEYAQVCEELAREKQMEKVDKLASANSLLFSTVSRMAKHISKEEKSIE